MKNFLVTALATVETFNPTDVTKDGQIRAHAKPILSVQRIFQIAAEAEGPEEAYTFVDEWLKDLANDSANIEIIADEMSCQPIDGMIVTAGTPYCDVCGNQLEEDEETRRFYSELPTRKAHKP